VKSLENAEGEADHLDLDTIGTECVLIALIRDIESDDVLSGSVANEGAAQVLQNLSVDLGSLLAKVLALIAGSTESGRAD